MINSRQVKHGERLPRVMIISDIIEFTETTKTLIYGDRRKAKRIIRNVEHGCFPGEYEGVKAKNN